MSSNIPTNEQNAVVADGSDDDSVSSMASQVAHLNLESSSPPPLLSSQVSDDEGDVTITKDVYGEDYPDEEGQIPFLDKDGEPVDEATPPEDFGSWPEYLLFCKQGPKLKIRLAVVRDGEAVGFRKVNYPKKMLLDHSEYFRGLLRNAGAMAESENGYVDLDDVDMVSFERVFMILSSGHPGAYNNIGPTFRTLSDLLDAAILCDRLMMRQIEAWVKKMMTDYIRDMSGWSIQYQREVVAHPNAGLLAQHKERVIDVSDAWERTMAMRADNIGLPLQPRHYVNFLITSCPKFLLSQVVHEFPPALTTEVLTQMLMLP
ncbi:hypothetical protein KVR01_003754 [Diaporthe batatas]|uniref:uncharacterized protein n=1 Tax=Diaporthe batatas TaxID=748121 RepID=UPI001D03F18C|nr:uncharacterized protein KVR01_003754 [Diaporthe batatas]KAG8168065.1 hypothetical protein KVR01_003754 [Diaporthe batatas]